MPITAKMSFRYLWRLGLISLICLGASLYCLYDGAIGYPKQHEALVEYRKLEKLKEDKELDEETFYERWEEVADERGWSYKRPKDEIDIQKQYWMAIALCVPGLLYLITFFRSRPRWIELNETGLRTSWGPRLEFDQITTLDKKKWKSKGIAIVSYKQDGRSGRLALDDWKFDTDETKAILREVESRIDVQQIMGGPPEPAEEQPEQEESQDETPQSEDAADQQEPTS